MSQRRAAIRLLGMGVLICLGCTRVGAQPPDVAACLRAINAVGPKGDGHRAAIAAWQELARAEAAQIPDILAGMDDSRTLAINWLHAAVESIAQRQRDRGGRLPRAALERFVLDTSHAPKARRAAYELLLSVDPTAHDRLIPGMANDPSMELRRDAVASLLARAEASQAAGLRSEAVAAFRKALAAARDRDQVEQAAQQLSELGQTVDLPRHFGFITHWQLIGPFDNTAKSGFDVAYGPQRDAEPADRYPGKEGVVRWIDYATDDPYGMVDLNKALGRFKGAIAYARAVFIADAQRDVQLRLGCVNANKAWLNGQLLFANNVYHSGTLMDQYVGHGRLRKGKNVILLKVAQNEQSESWAQRWAFQLRVCDRYGTAVLSSGTSNEARHQSQGEQSNDDSTTKATRSQ